MDEFYSNTCNCWECNGIVHTIRRGDTLYMLSRYYNVTIDEIMRANSSLNVYNLQVGDQICIPVGRPNMQMRPGMSMQPDMQMRPNMSGQMPNMNMNQMPGRPQMVQPRFEDEED